MPARLSTQLVSHRLPRVNPKMEITGFFFFLISSHGAGGVDAGLRAVADVELLLELHLQRWPFVGELRGNVLLDCIVSVVR